MTDTLPFVATPTVDPDVQSPNGDRLRVVPGDRNWVIRFIHPAQFRSRPNLVADIRAAHAELPQFGIEPPPRTYVLAEEDRDLGRSALVVTARIHGTSLAGAVSACPEARAAAEHVATALLRYYAHKYETNGSYFADMHIAQFMWGTHLHDPQPSAWMIDLDPGVGPFPPNPDARQVALLHWWIGETANSVVEIESRTGQPVTQYRHLLDQLERGAVFAHPSAAGRVDRMWEALETGVPFDPNEEWVQPQLG